MHKFSILMGALLLSTVILDGYLIIPVAVGYLIYEVYDYYKGGHNA